MYRKESGLTLINLVLSIIVMFILLAVSMSYVVGDRNYIEVGSDAVNESKRANVQEQFRAYVKDDLADGKDFFQEMVDSGKLKRLYTEGEGHSESGYDAKTDTDFFVITESGLAEIAPDSVKDEDLKDIRTYVSDYDSKQEFSYTISQLKTEVKKPELSEVKVFFIDRDLNVAYAIGGKLYGDIVAKTNPFIETTKWWVTE